MSMVQHPKTTICADWPSSEQCLSTTRRQARWNISNNMSAYASLNYSVNDRKPSSVNWTPDLEQLMISYFEQHRYLWDTHHILFHKRALRQQGFTELVELLGIDEATIRQRWTSMRSQFCREAKRVEVTPSYIPSWIHYESMLFLRSRGLPDVEEYLGSISGTQETDEDSENKIEVVVMDNNENSNSNQLLAFHQEEDELNPSEIPAIENRPTSIARARSRIQARTNRRWNPLYSHRFKNTTVPKRTPTPPTEKVERSKPMSENDCFTQYIGNVLKRFSPEKQRKCRNELLRIILKYDISDDESTKSTTST